VNLLLKREALIKDVTAGSLWIDGEFFCWTLEDPVRELVTPQGWVWRPILKVVGKTAIPSGRYPVTVTFSNRFRRRMPLVMNVPDFTGVRFHGGVHVDHTEGCPLMGRWRSDDYRTIGNSESLTGELVTLIDSAERHGKVYVEVRNP
jgi:hypothetical protein